MIKQKTFSPVIYGKNQPIMRHSIKGIWLLLALALPGLSCSEATQEQKRGGGALGVEAIRLKASAFSTTVTAVGDLLANEQVEIKSPVAGHVMDVLFREGQQVRQGQVLVKIDDRSWQARKQGLEARLASAESELKRKRSLLQVEGASQAEVDQAEATVKDLKAQIRALALRIELSEVHAPFSGKVGLRDFSKGAYMAQGAFITNLVQTRKLRVNFTLPARYMAQVKEGSRLKVVSSASQDTAEARIYAINPVMDEETRSLHVRARLDNQEQKFMPGDFVKVILELQESSQALLLPAEAIIPELNTHVVYKVTNGKAVRQQVRIGKRTERRVQITGGLQQGDTVMVSGLLQVRAGQPVEVKALKTEGAL